MLSLSIGGVIIINSNSNTDRALPFLMKLNLKPIIF